MAARMRAGSANSVGRFGGIEALSLEGAGGLGGCLVSQDGAQEILKRCAGLVLIHGIRLAAGHAPGLTKPCENAESIRGSVEVGVHERAGWDTIAR